MESWFEMISEAKKIMDKYSVLTCGFCPEVQVGPKGHKPSPHLLHLSFLLDVYYVGFAVRCRGSSAKDCSTFIAVTMVRMHSRVRLFPLQLCHTRELHQVNRLKISPQDVEENICKLTEKGLTPQIGVILRDSYGISKVKSVTGSKILRIIKAHGFAPEIPQHLYHLIKKVVVIRKHSERNREGKDSKFRLILVESRIHIGLLDTTRKQRTYLLSGNANQTRRSGYVAQQSLGNPE
ncbi:hypothetical protein GH714_030606 [Hevea brasiliensis]|uniref:Small ribosomal subunit protein uS15 N-terminal domain-containing protein n=1 Tax=Hevea brasiliensis TaxID=3981 RepID=A0A6A6NDB2_HEVBR|nr:hypothetical protein GH714_030606 [Hevea brasiliensis]